MCAIRICISELVSGSGSDAETEPESLPVNIEGFTNIKSIVHTCTHPHSSMADAGRRGTTHQSLATWMQHSASLQVSGHGTQCRGTATWGKGGLQKQVEVRRRQKWSKPILTEITSRGGEEDSLSLLNFRSFTARARHRRVPYKTYPVHPAAPHPHHHPPCSTSDTPKPHLHVDNNCHV